MNCERDRQVDHLQYYISECCNSEYSFSFNGATPLDLRDVRRLPLEGANLNSGTESVSPMYWWFGRLQFITWQPLRHVVRVKSKQTEVYRWQEWSLTPERECRYRSTTPLNWCVMRWCIVPRMKSTVIERLLLEGAKFNLWTVKETGSLRPPNSCLGLLQSRLSYLLKYGIKGYKRHQKPTLDGAKHNKFPNQNSEGQEGHHKVSFLIRCNSEKWPSFQHSVNTDLKWHRKSMVEGGKI